MKKLLLLLIVPMFFVSCEKQEYVEVKDEKISDQDFAAFAEEKIKILNQKVKLLKINDQIRANKLDSNSNPTTNVFFNYDFLINLDDTGDSFEYDLLLKASKQYLEGQGLDLKSEDFKGMLEKDHRYIVIAIMLSVNENKGKRPVLRVIECIADGLGVKEIVVGGGKVATKVIAQKVAKKVIGRLIPYVGWGMFAYEFADCITKEE